MTLCVDGDSYKCIDVAESLEAAVSITIGRRSYERSGFDPKLPTMTRSFIRVSAYKVVFVLRDVKKVSKGLYNCLNGIQH